MHLSTEVGDIGARKIKLVVVIMTGKRAVEINRYFVFCLSFVLLSTGMKYKER